MMGMTQLMMDVILTARLTPVGNALEEVLLKATHARRSVEMARIMVAMHVMMEILSLETVVPNYAQLKLFGPAVEDHLHLLTHVATSAMTAKLSRETSLDIATMEIPAHLMAAEMIA